MYAGKLYRDLTPLEKKVFDAARNGWFISGVYEVSFKGHRRTFRADSIRWLASDVLRWYGRHQEHHADDTLYVHMLKAA